MYSTLSASYLGSLLEKEIENKMFLNYLKIKPKIDCLADLCSYANFQAYLRLKFLLLSSYWGL